MKRTLTKVMAAVMSVLMLAAVLASNAMAATSANVKQYYNYACIGDSVASGFGLPDYNRRGQTVVYRTKIEGSYGQLIARAVGATNAKGGKYYPRAYPGFTSGIFRYVFSDNYTPPEWELNQLENFSFNVYSPEVLARERQYLRDAVRNSNLITLDLGVNDTWYGTISLIYEIAKYGTVVGVEPRQTLAEELAKYGSMETVIRNAMFYLAGFAENPQLWATFWGWWVQSLSSYFLQYQANYNAIVQGIYDINPNITIVCLASGNSFRALNLTPGLRSGSLKLQWMGAPVQVDVPFVGTLTLPNFVHVSENPIANVTGVMYDFFYEPIRQAWQYKKPGQYFYADVTDYEMIMDHMSIPMYEFMTMDNAGFNPHATLAGNRYMADKILEVLPTR